MLEFIKELYGHQAWADAEQWNALEKFPASLNDNKIRERLHHIHLVQRSFLYIVKNEKPVFKELNDFAGMEELKEYAREISIEAEQFLNCSSESSINEVKVIPWFKDPPIQLTIAQALTQAAMHSHYHRAQNATRLRELGGEPPLTDLIIWYWKNKPKAEWV